MSYTKIAIEIMDSTGTWNDVTTAVMNLSIDGIGLTAPRDNHALVANAHILFNNQSKTYNPDVGVWSTALLENRRRIRVKGTGATLGKALSVQRSGTAGSDLAGFFQTVSNSFGAGAVFLLTWTARAQYDTQYNTDRVYISTSAEGGSPTIYTYTNKWVTYTLSFTAAVGPAINVTAKFDNQFPTAAASNAKLIEYKNISLTKNGGANLLTNGDFSNGFTGWTTYSTGSPAASITATVIDDYWYLFNGLIERIAPAPFIKAGMLTTNVLAVDFTEVLRLQNINEALQKNKTGDQLNTLIVPKANAGSYYNNVVVDTPVAYYRLDETSGATAADSTVNAFNGTYAGTVGYSATGALVGDTDTAITFNGSDTAVNLTIANFNFLRTGFTLECWIKPNGLPASTKTIFQNGAASATDQNMLWQLKTDGKLIAAFFGDDLTSSSAVTSAVYNHIVWSYDGTTITLYINGVSAGSAAHGPYIGTPTVVTAISPSGSFNGQIDEFAIYNYGLTAAQVTRHYNAGLGTYNLTRIPGTQQDTGRQTFAVAFDGYTKSRVSILDAVTQSAVSEYGRQWFDRDGTFRWGSRDFIPKLIVNTSKLTVSDGLAFMMQPVRGTDTLINRVYLVYHPRQVVASTVVLGQITSAQMIPPLQPGGIPGSITFTITFRDPTTQRVCGGDSVITPVATTDYLINDVSDGSGYNYTLDGSFKLGAVVVAASQATITVYNYAIGPLYITRFQVRGNAVYTYDPITLTAYDGDSICTYQEREYDKDLPFSNDGNFTGSLVSYLVTRYKNPFLEVKGFSADYKAQLNGIDLLSLELMDTITISDTQTGLSSVKHMITQIAYELTPTAGDFVGKVTFMLERLDDNAYWILSNTTYGVLGTTTKLYI